MSTLVIQIGLVGFYCEKTGRNDQSKNIWVTLPEEKKKEIVNIISNHPNVTDFDFLEPAEEFIEGGGIDYDYVENNAKFIEHINNTEVNLE